MSGAARFRKQMGRAEHCRHQPNAGLPYPPLASMPHANTTLELKQSNPPELPTHIHNEMPRFFFPCHLLCDQDLTSPSGPRRPAETIGDELEARLPIVTAPVCRLCSCGRAIHSRSAAATYSCPLHFARSASAEPNRGRYSIRRKRRALTTHWVRLVVSSFRIAFLT